MDQLGLEQVVVRVRGVDGEREIGEARTALDKNERKIRLSS